MATRFVDTWLGDTYTDGNAEVKGDLSVTGTATLRGAATIGGAATLSGNASVAGTLAVTDTVTLRGTADIGGAATVAGTLAVTDTVTLRGTADIGGAATVTGTLAVTDTVTMRGTADVGGALLMADAMVFAFTAGTAVTDNFGVILSTQTELAVDVPATDTALVPIGIARGSVAIGGQASVVIRGIATAQSDGSGTTIAVGDALTLTGDGNVVKSLSATSNVVGYAMTGSQTADYDIQVFVQPSRRS